LSLGGDVKTLNPKLYFFKLKKQKTMKKIFVKRISTGIIYEVFEVDGSVIRVYNNTTGEYTGGAFFSDEVEFLLSEINL